MLSNRVLCIFGAVFCFGLLAIAITLQKVYGMEPCSLCMAQRYILLLLGLVFTVSIFTVRFSFLRVIDALLILVGALAGITLALRHLWIQSLPADQVPTCGPGFEYLIDNFPIIDAINALWAGSGDCHDVDKVFGLPISMWTLMAFVVILVIALRLLFNKERPQYDSGYSY